MTIQGIDVSKHNGTINWAQVKGEGKKEFVFIRLGWCGWDGRIKANGGLDPLFLSNYKGAKSAGIKVGVYLYSYAKTPAAGRAAAFETLEIVKDLEIDYPIAFDMESVSGSEANGAAYDKNTKEYNNSIVQAYLDVIEADGYYGMLYTYTSFANSYLKMSDLKKYDVWIAQYASKVTYSGSYGIWQYAGDVPGFRGTCPGITGACDLNIAYKDYDALIRAAGLNNSNPGTPEEQKDSAEIIISDLEKIIQRLKELNGIE